MDRTKFIVAHGLVDSERWAKRYGIEPFSHPCSVCGAMLTTTVPFFYRELRGLLAPTCSCGFIGTPYCVVSLTGDIPLSR